MRKIVTFLVVVLFSATLCAQSPEKMSYQAVVRNNSEELVTNQTVGMQISILQGSAAGTPVSCSAVCGMEMRKPIGRSLFETPYGPVFARRDRSLIQTSSPRLAFASSS